MNVLLMRILIHPNQKEDPGKLAITPANLQKFVVSAGKPECRTYSFGSILMQKFEQVDVKIYLVSFDIKRSFTLYPYVSKSKIVLQFLLAGDPIFAKNNELGEMLIGSDTFGLFYLPSGSNRMTLYPGVYHSLHFELTTSWLETGAKDREAIKTIVYKLRRYAVKKELLLRVPIGPKVKRYLYYVLNILAKKIDPNIKLSSILEELLITYAIEMSVLQTAYGKENKNAEEFIELYKLIKKFPNIHYYALANLAMKFSFSRVYVSKLFKRVLGMTAYDYIRKECMEEAILLLTTTSSSIDDISKQLGYDNVANFSKFFKKYVGLLPKDVRKAGLKIAP